MKENLPEFLTKMLIEQYGEELAEKIIDGYGVQRKVTFRVNTLKTTAEEIETILNQNNIKYKKVDWYDDAFIVEEAREADLQKLDIYEQGKIYLQSLSSMLPPIILDPKEGVDILDMAAAPGGKTTQMATMTSNKAHITACEINKIRAERLKFNLDKQGASSVYVMQKDASKLEDFFSFDQILLDSPCSGSGTLNSNNGNIEKFFNEKLINNCSRIQYNLLKKAINILKPGFQMVYSTCSILQKENEDIVNRVLKETKAKIVPIEFNTESGIELLPTKIEGTLCVCPNKLYEGFFIAKIEKEK